jgi:TonB-linked SusC/RagA family outer membrane protein
MKNKKFLILLSALMMSLSLMAQDKISISGVVTDDRGEPIIGANITVLGSTFAAMTDVDGKFTVKGPEGSDLKISCIGYNQKTVKSGTAYLKVILSEDSHQLKEAVAIGYGTVKRENLLGAVSSISAQDIEDIPAGNLSQTLVGKLAAVSISQTTGRPGATTPLTIRTSGSFSTGSDKPIFVIDGIIREQDAFDMLDPKDVENISILKDAAAAVYGSRGAGGAVVVTLKKGAEGKAKISYSGQYGFTQPTSFPTMLSAYDQATLINESLKYNSSGGIRDYASNTASYTPDELEAFKGMDYNWLDAAWKNSNQYRHNMSISGGSNKVRYYTGGSIWKETGNFANIEVNKFSLRSSLEADVSTSVKLGLELSLSNKKTHYPYLVGDNEENMNGFYKQLLCTPRWFPYEIDGRYQINAVNTAQNPLGLLNSDSYKSSDNKTTSINASMQYQPQWLKGLTASVRFGYDSGNGASRQYVSPYEIWSYYTTGTHGHIVDVNSPHEMTIANRSNQRLNLTYDVSGGYQLNAGLNYNRTWGKHTLAAMLNYEQSESNGNGSTIRAINQQIPGLERIEAFQTVDLTSSSISNSGRLGLIGRINYDYNQKYLLEATFREEASVKFDAGHRMGFFPSVALGWRISEEPFFKDNVYFMDYLKLRGSAGLLGQDNGVGTYEYLYSYNLASAAYFGTSTDANLANGLSPKNNGLVTIGTSWEKTQSYNIGIDTKFLQGKFDFSIDSYYRHTWDIFDKMSVTFTDIVGTLGSNIPLINFGIQNSWGTDIEMGYNGKISNDANYSIKANFSWGDNVCVKRNQDTKWANTYAWYVGQSSNRGEYGYKTSGIFRTQEQVDAYMVEHPGMTYNDSYVPAVGMLIFQDVARPGNAAEGEPYYVNEPDGKVNEYDIVPLFKKSGTPYAIGMSFGASYKSLRADLTLTGGFGGNEIMNKVERVGPSATVNVPDYWKDSWTAETPNATFPSVAYNGLNELPSSFWVRSSTLIRVRDLNVSYVVPKNFTAKLGISSLRVFLTGTNLFTIWSDYGFKDPNLARYYDYPILRSFNLGVNLSL